MQDVNILITQATAARAGSAALWALGVSISALLGTTLYNAWQVNKNLKETRLAGYRAWLERYFKIKELLIQHAEVLGPIYEPTSSSQNLALSQQQREFIYMVLVFCSGIHQTNQMVSHKKRGASWENYILAQLKNPNIRKVWIEETRDASTSAFDKAFVDWVNARLEPRAEGTGT